MEPHGADLTGIAIVLAGAVISGLALQSLLQSPIVGYILAGVLLGLSGAGLVRRSDEVSTLAELGVVLLLFLVGMELSLKAFVRVLRPAALVAGGQIAASLRSPSASAGGSAGASSSRCCSASSSHFPAPRSP